MILTGWKPILLNNFTASERASRLMVGAARRIATLLCRDESVLREISLLIVTRRVSEVADPDALARSLIFFFVVTLGRCSSHDMSS
jgi:hypothetical protein